MYDNAVNDYTLALQLEPNNIHALHNRGICYQKLAKFNEAIEDFTLVIKSNPNNSSAYFNRGCCFDSQGNVNKAINDYSIALQIDSKAKEKTQNMATVSNSQV